MVCLSKHLFDGHLGRRVGLLGAVLVATCLVAGGVGGGMVTAARRLEGSTGRFWSGRLGVLLAAIGARGATVGAFDLDVGRRVDCGDPKCAARRCGW